MSRVMTCTYCGEKGHNKRGCPIRKRDEEFKEYLEERENIVKLVPNAKVASVQSNVKMDLGPNPTIDIPKSTVDEQLSQISSKINLMLRLQQNLQQMVKYLIFKEFPTYIEHEIPYKYEQMQDLAIGSLRIVIIQWLPAEKVPFNKKAAIDLIIKRKEFQSSVRHIAGKYNMEYDMAARAITLSNELNLSVAEVLALI